MPTDQPKSSPKKQLDSYVRYSAMGLQMGAIIFFLTYGGIKLDAYLQLHFPVFTLLFACTSVVVALWYFIRDFLPKKD